VLSAATDEAQQQQQLLTVSNVFSASSNTSHPVPRFVEMLRMLQLPQEHRLIKIIIFHVFGEKPPANRFLPNFAQSVVL